MLSAPGILDFPPQAIQSTVNGKGNDALLPARMNHFDRSDAALDRSHR